MKSPQKSHANSWPFYLVGFIIIIVAFFKHPSIRSSFELGNSQMWGNLLIQTNDENQNFTQDFWKFREFYSKGTIYLQKYQDLLIPNDIIDVYALPNSFEKYLLFKSNNVVSIEGFVDPKSEVFVYEDNYLNRWEVIKQTKTTQILKSKSQNVALVISKHNLDQASIANGYLHFDLRDKAFWSENQNKKWLVVCLVTLDK